jgi:phosphopentomutase
VTQAVLIILDGIGVGDAPDAEAYGDAGSDTLGNTARAVGGLTLPILGRLGLGNLHAVAGVPPAAAPEACFGRLTERSAGKDSTTGHWELLGLITTEPLPTYPDGFPADVIAAFSAATGYGVLGNEAASGTEIIERLGDEHVATGKLIVYTSADSVFQIAAHEEVVPLAELYRVCEIARDLLVPPHQVSRVIARPFRGTGGAYRRTPDRRDYSLRPPDGLVLDTVRSHGVTTVAIGKINDLFAGRGIDTYVPSKGNAEGMRKLAERYAGDDGVPRLLLVNLVDFDMLWGHRNDAPGMQGELERFDAWLGGFVAELRSGDLLLISADHGNDPTTPSTDHSRERVPLLAYLAGGPPGCDLGTRATFADLGATIADYFGAPPPASGASFWGLVNGADRPQEQA